MPRQRYRLERGQPPSLTLIHRRSWNGLRVELDGEKVLEVATVDELRAGRTAILPRGGEIRVRLERGWRGPALNVMIDGRPVPGSAGDPRRRVEAASFLLLFVAAASAVWGLVAEASDFTQLTGLGAGWTALGYGLALGGLGFGWQSFALGLALGALAVRMLGGSRLAGWLAGLVLVADAGLFAAGLLPVSDDLGTLAGLCAALCLRGYLVVGQARGLVAQRRARDLAEPPPAGGASQGGGRRARDGGSGGRRRALARLRA